MALDSIMEGNPNPMITPIADDLTTSWWDAVAIGPTNNDFRPSLRTWSASLASTMRSLACRTGRLHHGVHHGHGAGAGTHELTDLNDAEVLLVSEHADEYRDLVSLFPRVFAPVERKWYRPKSFLTMTCNPKHTPICCGSRAPPYWGHEGVRSGA